MTVLCFAEKGTTAGTKGDPVMCALADSMTVGTKAGRAKSLATAN